MAKKESKSDNKIKKHFFKDFKAELKKVIWPTPKQLVNSTVAVVTIVLLAAVIVFILDAVFDLGNRYGITQLQNIVNERFNNNEDVDDTENIDSDDDESDEENESTGENNATDGDTTENTDSSAEKSVQ